jgi:hypothetical protein
MGIQDAGEAERKLFNASKRPLDSKLEASWGVSFGLRVAGSAAR